MKVVDLINNSPSASRPTVLVSATAVGYYGMFLIEHSVRIQLVKKLVCIYGGKMDGLGNW